MPLAIELAAARVRLLRVEHILARLKDHMDLLDGGRRVGPPRHQTLRATIDWSYNLLPPEEQRLLRRLAIFSGGFTLEAVESVCDEDKPGRSIESLAQLVKKSLVVAVRSPGREARYDLHETIYQYAWARLEEEGAANRLLDRHVDYFFRQAEQAQPHLYFDYLKAYREWWETEYSNLRAALSRAFAGQASGLEAALPLSARLASYWAFGGPLSEGHYWLKLALKEMRGAPVPVRAALFLNAGFLSFLQGDPQGVTLVLKSLPLYRRLEDDRGVCRVYVLLGNWALEVEGDVEKAKALYNQALARAVVLHDSVLIFRAFLGLGDSALIAGNYSLAREYSEKMLPYAHDIEERRAAKYLLASITLKEQDYEQATALLLEALALARSMNGVWYISNTLKSLGDIARVQRNYDRALSYYSDSLTIARANNLRTRISIVIGYLGHILLRRGDPRQGASHMRESLEIHRAIASQVGIAWNLWGFGLVAVLVNMPFRAATLYAAAETPLRNSGRELAAADIEDYARDVALVRNQLGDETFAAAWAEGQAMLPEQAIAYALENVEAEMLVTREPAPS
jgi:tetratricopeptide (TPR) repeat protein